VDIDNVNQVYTFWKCSSRENNELQKTLPPLPIVTSSQLRMASSSGAKENKKGLAMLEILIKSKLIKNKLSWFL
jgi:hypothetical protein